MTKLTMSNALVKNVDIKLLCDAVSSLEYGSMVVNNMVNERTMVTEIVSTGTCFTFRT